MAKKHFQWQNEHLKRTIYPLREMKLRDFLIYYYEIDLWSEYKDKSPEDPDVVKEMAAFEAVKEKQLIAAYENYQEKMNYLQKEISRLDIYQKFKTVDKAYLDKLIIEHKNFREYFVGRDSTRKQGYYLSALTKRTEETRKRIVQGIEDTKRKIRNVPTSNRRKEWEDTLSRLEYTLPMIDEELNNLYEFAGIFKKVQKDLDYIQELIKAREEEIKGVDYELKRREYLVKITTDEAKKGIYEDEAAGFRAEKQKILDAIDQLRDTSPESMRKTLAARASSDSKKATDIRDVVRWKVEMYKNDLEKMDHDQLLEEIVRKFLDNPTRYPLWLQYMVIHFSGMRYKSAHGSWGDPKDLLLSLRIRGIEEKTKENSDDVIEAESLREISELKSRIEEARNPIPLENHIRRLESPSIFHKRRALLDYRIDQEKDSIEEMTDEEALDSLQAMKDQLPDWMWKQIVEVTQLRVNEVQSTDWEELTEDEKAEYLDSKSAEFRQIMNDWKQKNLTMWREEHKRENRLIVSRAVCNEVAEHIQHLRGHSPPGGLTAKPEWYLRAEKAAAQKTSADKSCFVKPYSASDFKPGASILWLRWVNGKPNPWRITHPLTLNDGSELLPAGLVSSQSVKQANIAAKKLVKALNAATDWVYENTGDGFRRTRVVYQDESLASQSTDQSGNEKSKKKTKPSNKGPRLVPVEQVNWLRWMHEATVAEVAETADGTTILTFETALPYEDPRRSTIGVFQHTLGGLRYNVTKDVFIGSFVGYLPEGELPIDDLKEMLDWNKILQKNVVSQREIDAYWKKVTTKAPAEKVAEGGQKTPETMRPVREILMEASPTYSRVNHREFVVCYEMVKGRRGDTFKAYSPRIELWRGVQLFVSDSDNDKKKVGKTTYYRVTNCESQPRAKGLYIQDSDFLLVSGDKPGIPMVSKGKLTLRMVKKTNAKGKPIAESAKRPLPGGVKFRVSAVQHERNDAEAKLAGKVDGIIDTDGTTESYLIVECPTWPSIEGMWVREVDVERISEEEYAIQPRGAALEMDEEKPRQVKVTPSDGLETASIFRGEGKASGGGQRKADFASFKKDWRTVGKETILTVGPPISDKSGRTYHEILECKDKPKLVTFFINPKDISPLIS